MIRPDRALRTTMTMTHRLAHPLICLAIMGGVLLNAAPAQAHRTITMYEYFGQHPVRSDLGTWCDQDALHVHSYALDTEEYLVYEIDGVFHFVGDAFLHRGHMHHWYYDPHPISHISSHWCVLEGPHSHWWRPRQHQHQTTWVSYDGYWVWDGEYSSSFWWTWSTWYAPFWIIHNRRVHRHHSYHPGHHYHEGHRARPRYDGRHRHRHYSDHRMRGARERHSRWYGSESSEGERHRTQAERRDNQPTEREHSGPNELRDGVKASSSGPPRNGVARTGYRLPGAADEEPRKQEPGEQSKANTKSNSRIETRSGYSSPTKSSPDSKPKSSKGSGTSVPDYRKATTGSKSRSNSRSSSKTTVPSYGSPTTTSPIPNSSSSSKSRSNSRSKTRTTVPSYGKATTASPSSKSSSSSKSRSNSSYRPSSKTNLPNYGKATTTSPSRRSSSSSKSRTQTSTKPTQSDDEQTKSKSKSKKARTKGTSSSKNSRKTTKEREKR